MPTTVSLCIGSGLVEPCTTLLQSGVVYTVDKAISIGQFLLSLPGFTEKYIADEVQTIFLNGNATDDLAALLTGPSSTLALSAAMPGLAGAIFRRNSLHATLRTTTTDHGGEMGTGQVVVTLKLFNMVARDKGGGLLAEGVTVKARELADFLHSRQPLATRIEKVTMNGQPCSMVDLLASLMAQPDLIRLQIT